MQRLQAYKFELVPNGQQQRDMRRFAGACRFVFNKALALQKENYEAGNKYIGYVSMAANLPIWKREAGTQWLKETPSQALQHALKDLEKAYKNFFANARRDFLHKATTTISQNHALVCIEDLQIKNMSRSAKGNSEQHGKKVSQKSGLNRSILDQGWGEFRRQLAYKLEWHGGILIAVPPHNTSRTCPCCGYISKENRPTQVQFLCVDCGYENHADVVGAINVLERGQRLLACGESAQSGRSMKQEPTEATQEVFA